MRIEFVPLLQLARELHDLPRGMERFQTYLATITGGADDDVALPPLISMNPMGREHVAARLDEWIAMGAEDVARTATIEAAQELADVPADLKLGLVIVDDLRGGWTNRYFSEFNFRFGTANSIKRAWIAVPLWVSEAPSRAAIRAAVRAAIYRAAYVLRHHQAQRLGQMLAQEGLTAIFAEPYAPPLTDEELAYVREVIRPHLEATEWSVVFPCLYGDPVASALGYEQLGLPDRAGFAVADAVARSYLQRTNRSALDALATTDEIAAAAGFFD